MDFKPNLSFFRKRHKVPTIFQMEATECGAACLSMVFSYHKNWLPLEQLRVECHITHGGASAATLLSVARSHGFQAKGIQTSLARLKNSRFPLILFWDYIHYVVLEGVSGDKYYVNDPAEGRKTFHEEEFKKKFTGICLLFEPGENFKPNNQTPPSNLKVLWPYISKNIPEYIYLCLTAGLLVAFGLYLPFFIKNLFDNVIQDPAAHSFNHPILLPTCLVLLMSLGFNILQKVVLARLEMKINFMEARQIVSHTLKLPLMFFKQRYPGDLSQRLSSIESLSLLIGFAPVMVILSLVSLTVYGIAMFFYSQFMATIVCGFAVVYLFTFSRLSKKLTEESNKMGNESGVSYGWSANAIKVIDTIKSNGSSAFLFERCIGYVNKVIRAYNQVLNRSNLIGLLPITILTLFTAFIFSYGGWAFHQGQMALGDILAFQMLSLNFLQPISTIITSGSQLATSRANFDRINDILHHQPDTFYQNPHTEKKDQIRKKINAQAERTLSGAIELRNVTFGYDRKKEPMIEGLSLTIRPKERIVFLGKSGSGKSTLAQLICGLMEPWSGDILFDGEKISLIPPDILAQSISYVNQDVALFDGTIRDNLSFWNPNFIEQDMMSALNIACIDKQINERPNRLDTLVLSGGSNFSGGERQRLELARALTNSPSILILDEATSALDPIIEAEIESRLRREGYTCIVIAHRLSTVRNADQLIVLDKGHIVEQGRHEELIAKEGYYNQLLSNEDQLL